MDWHHGGAGFEYGVGWTSGKSGKKRRYSVPEVRRKLLLEIEQVLGGPSLPRVFLNKKPGGGAAPACKKAGDHTFFMKKDLEKF